MGGELSHLNPSRILQNRGASLFRKDQQTRIVARLKHNLNLTIMLSVKNAF